MCGTFRFRYIGCRFAVKGDHELEMKLIVDSISLHWAMNVITDCASKTPTSSVRSQSVEDF